MEIYVIMWQLQPTVATLWNSKNSQFAFLPLTTLHFAIPLLGSKTLVWCLKTNGSSEFVYCSCFTGGCAHLAKKQAKNFALFQY